MQLNSKTKHCMQLEAQLPAFQPLSSSKTVVLKTNWKLFCRLWMFLQGVMHNHAFLYIVNKDLGLFHKYIYTTYTQTIIKTKTIFTVECARQVSVFSQSTLFSETEPLSHWIDDDQCWLLLLFMIIKINVIHQWATLSIKLSSDFRQCRHCRRGFWEGNAYSSPHEGRDHTTHDS